MPQLQAFHTACPYTRQAVCTCELFSAEEGLAKYHTDCPLTKRPVCDCVGAAEACPPESANRAQENVAQYVHGLCAASDPAFAEEFGALYRLHNTDAPRYTGHSG